MSFAFLGATRFNGTIDCSGGAGGSITGTTGFDALNSSAIATGATYPTATNITANRGFFLQVTRGGTLTVDSVGVCKTGDWIVSNGTTWQKLALEDVTAMVVMGDLDQNGFHLGSPRSIRATTNLPPNGIYTLKGYTFIDIDGDTFVDFVIDENGELVVGEDADALIERWYTPFVS